MAKCDLCGDTGKIQNPKDDLRVEQCVCAYIKALRAHLSNPVMALDVGLDLVSTPSIRKSSLLTNSVDRTNDNLLLQGPWSHVLPHLKFVLGYKGLAYRFRFVSDERLLNVWLGKSSYGAKSRQLREEEVYFNSVSDLVNPDFDLVIIRLGVLGYKNKALPGILLEALQVRAIKEKATWVVEQGSYSCTKKFERSMAYSEEALNLLDPVDLTNPNQVENVFHVDPEEVPEVDSDGVVSMGAPVARPPRGVVSKPVEEPLEVSSEEDTDSSEDFELPGALGGGPKKFKPGKRQKRFGGNS